jgi:hypothetical protein
LRDIVSRRAAFRTSVGFAAELASEIIPIDIDSNRLTEKGIRAGDLFMLFHKRVCVPVSELAPSTPT